MNDYGALAEKLRGSWHAAIPAAAAGERTETSLSALFDRVKVQIIDEVKSANEELRKRRLATIDRVFVPCYRGRLCLTFGTALLCVVELDEIKGRVVSVILGPPNREEISRKEFLPGPQVAKPEEGLNKGPEMTAAADRTGRIASEIVSEILETGIRLMQKRPEGVKMPEKAVGAIDPSAALSEFWISLASLLRSYTAVHGLSDKRQATVEWNEETISVRHGIKWLRLERKNALVTWTRENGRGGLMELTRHGNLLGPDGEEAMDLTAEFWARELMHDHATEPA